MSNELINNGLTTPPNALVLLQRRRMLMANNNSSPIVLPYTPLSWVGSTSSTNSGRVGFNAEIRLLSTMTFELDVEVAWSNWAPVIQAAASNGVTWAKDKNQLYIYRNDSNSYDYLYFGSTSLGQPTGGQGRHKFKLNGGLWIDNTKKLNITTTKSVAEGGSIWFGGYKVYGFKVWDSGTLIVNMIPALKDGQYGLWDTIRERFFTKISGTITGE